MRRYLLVAGLGLAALAPLALPASDPQAGAPPATTEAYRLAEIVRLPLTERVPATGTVQPVALVSVSSQTSGQVKDVYVDFNDIVAAGDPLALIDPLSFEIAVDRAEADLDIAQASLQAQDATIEKLRQDIVSLGFDRDAAQASVDQARALVEDARADLARKQALGAAASAADRQRSATVLASAEAQLRVAAATEGSRASNIVSARSVLRAAEAQRENLLAQIRQSEASLRQARAELDRTVIRAPVDGSVTVRSVEIGQTVAVSLQAPILFTIAQDQRQMQVMATVGEADIGRIRLDQAFSFTVDAHPDRVFEGEVVQIRVQPQMAQNVVSYTVVATAPNPELLLLPGMTATSSIVTARTEPVLAVPSAALRFRPPGDTRQGAPRIHVLRDGVLQPVEVVTGITDGSLTEIRAEGLDEGMPVVTGLADMRRSAPPPARSGLLGFLQ